MDPNPNNRLLWCTGNQRKKEQKEQTGTYLFNM